MLRNKSDEEKKKNAGIDVGGWY